MLIPTYYAKELANIALSSNVLADPERFKSFCSDDYISYDEFSGASESTWNQYSFLSVKSNGIPTSIHDIIGVMQFPVSRPTKHINGIKITLFQNNERRTFYSDMMACLARIKDNGHPSLKFATFADTDAHRMYENLCRKGYLIKYEVPFDWSIANDKIEYWHRYAMSNEMLSKFLENRL